MRYFAEVTAKHLLLVSESLLKNPESKMCSFIASEWCNYERKILALIGSNCANLHFFNGVSWKEAVLFFFTMTQRSERLEINRENRKSNAVMFKRIDFLAPIAFKLTGSFVTSVFTNTARNINVTKK